MRTILIAGGAGFIGSHLCKKLLNSHQVVCVDNYVTGNRANIEELLQNPNFEFIEHDLTKDPSDILAKFSSIDAIFHLASPASPNKNSKKSYINFPIETLLVNSLGTFYLLEEAKKRNSTFLYVSSSEIYGDPLVSPQSEDYFGNVNPNGLRSVYDEGKRFGEAMSFGYLRKFDLDVRIVRVFNTYGPFMQVDDGRVVSNFISQALRGQELTIYGKGTQTRSFCYVDDMVEAFEKAMFTPGTKGEVINLGNPDERSILDLARLIQQLTQSSSEIVYLDLPEDDPQRRCPDITKAQKLLQWNPRVPLTDGLTKTIEYFKKVL